MYRNRSFGTGGRWHLPASVAGYRIPCLILCLAYVERKRMDVDSLCEGRLMT